VLGRDATPDTLAIRDVFARDFRVAFSHENGTLRLAVDGETASATFPAQALDEQWEMLFLGAFNPILSGTARPFSGLVSFWRYIPEVLDEGALARLTAPDRPMAPGESTAVILDSVGQQVMSADGAGRLDFTPGRRALMALTDAADPDGMLPADAIATRLMPGGDVHFLASSYGEPFGEHLQRATRLASEAGLTVGNRGLEFEALWGNGQSLMYANTYGAPVNWPDHPWFLDVDDDLSNSVFGFSSAGRYSDRLKYPELSQDPVGGAGGVVYPVAHALARLDCAKHDSPPPRIAKSIGQSGEQIRQLWPWGVYNPDGTVKTGMNEQHWLNVRRWHQSVVDAVTRLGGKVTMPAHVWVQATADENNQHYYGDLDKSRADLAAITDEFFGPFGQTRPPLWVMTQGGGRVNTASTRWPVVMEELRYAEDHVDDGVVLAAPLHAPDITLADGNVHPDYASTTRFG